MENGTQVRNFAAQQIEYFEHEDFEGAYKDCLFEDFANNESEIIDRLQDLFNVSNYETNRYLAETVYIDKPLAEKIYTFISDNLNDFICNYNGYYVGYTSLASINFGEQEENLQDLSNSYGIPLKVLQDQYDSEGWVVIDTYAYHDMQSGLHVELVNDSLKAFLIENNLIKS